MAKKFDIPNVKNPRKTNYSKYDETLKDIARKLEILIMVYKLRKIWITIKDIDEVLSRGIVDYHYVSEEEMLKWKKDNERFEKFASDEIEVIANEIYKQYQNEYKHIII